MPQREDKERIKTARENLGKYFYDLSKTSFAVMVAGNILTILKDDQLTFTNAFVIITGIFLNLGICLFSKQNFKEITYGIISIYIWHLLYNCSKHDYLDMHSRWQKVAGKSINP